MAEGGGLLNRYRLVKAYRGFESLRLRHSNRFDMTVWPAPVIRLFLGEFNVEQTFGAAFDTDPQTKAAQTCEANFYAGEFALLKKDKKEAQRLLKLAADNCPPSFIESTAAVAALIPLK